MELIKLYFVTLPVFLLLDFSWLAVIAKNFYSKQIGSLVRPDVNYLAAVAFYLLFSVGLVVFVISPALQKHSWVYALGMGALFGLISYATYDLTNLATLKNWPMIVTIVDLIWGAVLSALVATIVYFIKTKIMVN